jgi:hypothetical protein
VLWLAAIPAAGSAQQQRPAVPAQLGVFLDCRTNCDSDLIRTEIGFVNWLRDRTDAHVHVLVTSQQAGAGGELITLAFMGLGALATRGDTLTVATNPTTTSDERRRSLTNTLSLGLVQFAARTAASQTIRVSQDIQAVTETPTQMTPATDPWKAWVFEIEAGGSTDGERNYRSREFDAGIGANRTTEAWKLNLDLQFFYDDERVIDIEYDDEGNVVSEDVFTALRRNWNAELLLVKSLTGHLSAGLRSGVGSDIFRNHKLSVQLTPALEYNIFPYSESTRRELTLQYGVGYQSYRYQDTTIFDRIEESLPVHYAAANYYTRQPWGSTSVELRHQNFLNDASKRSTSLEGELSVRLFRGFSVNLGGEYSWIRDQISLRKGDRDPVDVLLRRQQLLTGFEYDARISFSYTFGSIFNNVVNPRF